MTPIDEAQLGDPFIHSIVFGIDGVEIVLENKADVTELVRDRISREIVCEDNPHFENIYLELQTLARKLAEEAGVVKRNPEY
jgi:hypothetical protein